MPGPLDGIRVLEFSEIIAAPFAGMLLADMGAEVIKVEPPWGEPWRLFQQFVPLESRAFISLNRGKRSLPLDLTRSEARDIVYKLIPEIDVVIVNYRPDVPYRLGIDYETLLTKNPKLIYCENTAFGRNGPDSQRPGYDIIAQAMTGLMAAEMRIVNNLPQMIQASPVADFATGIAIAWGVSSALYVRERTGRGQKIEASLLGSALGVQTSRFLNTKLIDEAPLQEFLTDLDRLRKEGASYEDMAVRYQDMRPRPPGNIYYRTYQAKDGVLAVGCLSDSLRKKLLDVLNLHDIRYDPGYDPITSEARIAGETLIQHAEELFRQKTVSEWLGILDTAGVPSGPLRFVEELFHDEQVQANDLVVEVEHPIVGPVQMVGPIIKMSETSLEARTASPTLGQDTEAILSALGYSTEETQRFRDDGVTY
jgi:formyl-CoA transferase